jgi:hypothetical protein
MKNWHGARGTQPEKIVPGLVWYKKSREGGRSEKDVSRSRNAAIVYGAELLKNRYIGVKGSKPPRVSEDGEETSHVWKAWETVTRSLGKPEEWSS